MKKSRVFSIPFFIIIGIVIVISVLFSIAYFTYPVPPVKEVEDARKALSHAKKARSDLYAVLLYEDAGNLYDSAIIQWKGQNEKWFMTRDYTKTRDYALRCQSKANEAKRKALEEANNLNILLKNNLDSLRKKAGYFNDVYKELPLSVEIINAYEKGKLLLKEGEYAYLQHNYPQCYDNLRDASEYIDKAYRPAEIMLNRYFENLPYWKKIAGETIKRSKQKGTASIIIDKFSKRCYLYQAGKLTKTYRIELGRNWIGDKQMKGDKTTPEGEYHIVKKIDRNHTKYHKALLLNYPNPEDKKRFFNNVLKGILPKTSEIGGMIEIHGEGGKGANWTDGCIALKNEDMNDLYLRVTAGTPVTIVGSIQDLEELITRNAHKK